MSVQINSVSSSGIVCKERNLVRFETYPFCYQTDCSFSTWLPLYVLKPIVYGMYFNFSLESKTQSKPFLTFPSVFQN
jgi:hypothetical protein